MYIITGDETDDHLSSTRCRITEDHGNYEYSWELAPATEGEALRVIEQLEATGRPPIWSVATPMDENDL